MKISFGTPYASSKITGKNGYGYATKCMLNSLDELGYSVKDNDPTADVEIYFNQPQHWNFSPVPYKIGYHPWESTQLLPGWADIMNQCDEIWTPSPIVADWYTRYAGVRVPVYVYEHGIDHFWQPVKREPGNKIKFLHVGAEASRKAGWDTVDLFRRAFNGYRDDVALTLKMINSSWNGIEHLGKVHYLNREITLEQMRDLFYYNDIFVYPSYGEGFGLLPLQAIASGMPTITVPAWAPYADLLDPRLNISSELKPTQWPEIHPGLMWRPNFDDVIDRMRFAADNYDDVRDYACSHANEVHEKYDWNDITKKMFEGLEERLGRTT